MFVDFREEGLFDRAKDNYERCPARKDKFRCDLTVGHFGVHAYTDDYENPLVIWDDDRTTD